MKTFIVLLTTLVVLAINPSAMAEDIYINGGTNTFNDATYENDWVHLGEGGRAGFSPSGRIGWLSLYDNSMFNMGSGEIVHQLIADDSFIDFYGGTVGGSLVAQNYATILMTGGTVGDSLEVLQNGKINLYGTNFFSAPGLYGIRTPLSPRDKLSDFGTLVSEPGQTPYYTGFVTGTLLDGTPLNNTFKIEVSNDSYHLFGDIHIRRFMAYGAVVVALSQEENTGLLMKNNPTLTVVSEVSPLAAETIVVNSSAEDALLVQGNATISADSLDVAGGMTIKGSLSYPEEMYIYTDNDYIWPDFEIEEPDFAGLPDMCPINPNTGKASPVVIPEGQWILESGYYSAGIIVKGGIVTLQSGIYHLGSEAKANSGLVLKGDAVVDANEVMFHIVGTGEVSIGKNVTLTATAPTSGDCKGFLFFQSRENTSPAVFKGVADCTGRLYFPANHVEISGDVLCSMLMANTIELSGNAELIVDPYQ